MSENQGVYIAMKSAVKEVPRLSRAKQRQGNPKKSVLHVQSSFFAN